MPRPEVHQARSPAWGRSREAVTRTSFLGFGSVAHLKTAFLALVGRIPMWIPGLLVLRFVALDILLLSFRS